MKTEVLYLDSPSSSVSSEDIPEVKAQEEPEEILVFTAISKPAIVVDLSLPLTPRSYISRYQSLIEIEEEIHKTHHLIAKKPIITVQQIVQVQQIQPAATVELKEFSQSFRPRVSLDEKFESSSESEGSDLQEEVFDKDTHVNIRRVLQITQQSQFTIEVQPEEMVMEYSSESESEQSKTSEKEEAPTSPQLEKASKYVHFAIQTQEGQLTIIDQSLEIEPEFPEIQIAHGMHPSSPDYSDSSDESNESEKDKPARELKPELVSFEYYEVRSRSRVNILSVTETK